MVAEILFRVLMLVRLPGMPGLVAVMVVPLVLAMGMGVAVLMQMLVGMAVGMGMGMRHVPVDVGVGMHMAVLMAVLVLVLVPRGVVVSMAAVHEALPRRKSAPFYPGPGRWGNGDPPAGQ